MDVSALKDDGCNTNVISKDFVDKHPHLFRIEDTNITVIHSKKESREVATQVVMGTGIRIGTQSYRSNWAVADCRYDVLLGMTWNKDTAPKVSYEEPTVCIGEEILPIRSADDEHQRVKITNLGVKKFRSLLRKRQGRDDFAVFHVSEAKQMKKDTRNAKSRCKPLDSLLQKYQSVFR